MKIEKAAAILEMIKKERKESILKIIQNKSQSWILEEIL